MQLHKNIVTFFGVGYFPKAPGTAGAFVATLVIVALQWLNVSLALDYYQFQLFLLTLTIGTLFLGNYSINKLKDALPHDASIIVIDEVIGVWIALLLIPFSWLNYTLAFILFRIFDIFKPLFIRKIDNMKSNWSIMLDDVLAGIYANIVLQIFIYITNYTI
jgi:phosphatidylglycerophosphatase A